jgi:aspartyl-tRNA(Asn)/glutamyl-tRNA(Gln) amidotransferase subunit A
MASNNSAAERLSAAFERIDNPNGEGRVVCLTVYRASTLDAARASDLRARRGDSLGPLDGVVVTINTQSH